MPKPRTPPPPTPPSPEGDEVWGSMFDIVFGAHTPAPVPEADRPPTRTPKPKAPARPRKPATKPKE